MKTSNIRKLRRSQNEKPTSRYNNNNQSIETTFLLKTMSLKFLVFSELMLTPDLNHVYKDQTLNEMS